MVYYVDIPHTASASIRSALCLQSRPRHKPARLKRYDAKDWEGAWKFSVVRNPYARVARMYQRRKISHHNMGFADWIDLRFRCGRQPTDTKAGALYWKPQLEWLSDREGHVIVDYVGYFQHLRGTWGVIQRTLSIDEDLPHKNEMDLPDWKDLYTEETRGFVAEVFAEDFQRFGYDTELPNKGTHAGSVRA